MCADKVTSKTTEDESPLDISYSLRIGTSVYHVLGKRRKSRRNKYDYYVVDEKFIRSKSNKRAIRPRYIVDQPSRKPEKKPHDPSPATAAPMATEEIKHALSETMDDLEERLVQTIKQELGKVRLEAVSTQKERETARRDEEKRLKELFDEQKETMSTILKQQEEQTKATSASRIEAAITKALEVQQSQQQQLVSKEDILELENKLTGKIQEMVDGYKKIKIYNDLDMPALSQSVLSQHKKLQQSQESKIGAESSKKNSSTNTKKMPAGTSTQDQSEISHKHDE